MNSKKSTLNMVLPIETKPKFGMKFQKDTMLKEKRSSNINKLK